MTKHLPYLTAVLFSSACATDALSNASQAASERPHKAYEQLLCDPNMCVLHDRHDTDGDGTADIDERAAGTSPDDPLDHPQVADLAALISRHALPSFETGNSMLVFLPTRDANGLPTFGGDALTSSRKGAAERAGLELPGGTDFGLGFSLTRSMTDGKLEGHGLLWAIGKGSDITIAQTAGGAFTSNGRSLRDVVGTTPKNDGSTELGSFTGTDNATATDVRVDWGNSANSSYSEVHGDGINGRSTSHKDEAGNEYGHSELDTTSVDPRSGGDVKTETHTTTDTATSHDGRTTYSQTTVTTKTTFYDDKGNAKKTETSTTKTTKSCTDGNCTTTTSTNGNSQPTPTEAGDANGGQGTAYRNPDYDDHVIVTPQLVHQVLAARGANVDVVNPAYGPIIQYTYNPKDAGNHWGPVALVSGDDTDGTIGSPTMMHVPSATPDYDPNLAQDVPPPSIPPRMGENCTYCGQP